MSSRYLGYSIIAANAAFVASFVLLTYKLTALEVSTTSWLTGSIVLGTYVLLVSLLGIAVRLRNGRDMLALGAIIMSLVLAFGANLITELSYLGKNFITSLACPTHDSACLELAHIIAVPAGLALLAVGVIGTYTLTYLLIKEVEATYWIKDYGSLLTLASGTLIIAASALVIVKVAALSFGLIPASEVVTYVVSIVANTLLYVGAVLFTLGIASCCYLLGRELIKPEAIE